MPDFSIEDKYAGLVVAGVDEAGRGPWAGPVAAGAAVFLSRDGVSAELLRNLDDSKKLAPAKREKLLGIMETEARAGRMAFAVGMASAAEIDALNILQATFLAMKRAVSGLPASAVPEVLLVDGNRLPAGGFGFPAEAEAVVKGDGRSFSIAAASIAAKVARDRLMADLALRYPGYGFERNAGYGTAEHITALARQGVTPEHRKSYAPVKKVICNL